MSFIINYPESTESNEFCCKGRDAQRALEKRGYKVKTEKGASVYIGLYNEHFSLFNIINPISNSVVGRGHYGNLVEYESQLPSAKEEARRAGLKQIAGFMKIENSIKADAVKTIRKCEEDIKISNVRLRKLRRQAFEYRIEEQLDKLNIEGVSLGENNQSFLER
jgi:hypothetical protein